MNHMNDEYAEKELITARFGCTSSGKIPLIPSFHFLVESRALRLGLSRKLVSHVFSYNHSLTKSVPLIPVQPCVARTNAISRFMSRRWSIFAGED